MASKNSIKLFVGAGLMLAASGAFAAAQVSQTFGSDATAALSSFSGAAGTWFGDGTLEAGTPSGTFAGSPISDSSGGVILSVEGDVSCTNASNTAATSYETEFLINVPEASEELPSLDSEVQIALAAGTNVVSESVPLVVYCKPHGSESAAWTNTVSMTTGAWHRVTLAFDYGAGRCRVSLDGVPVVSDAGYLTTNDTTSTSGAWYTLAGTPAANLVKSLNFIGVAKVDDVLISDTIANNFTGSNTVTVAGVPVNVSYDDLNRWGIDGSVESLALELDDSELTVAQKLECGLDPVDGKKFEATAMSLGNGTATFTLPEGINMDNTTYTVYYSTTPTGEGTALDTTPSNGSVTASGIPTDAGDVLYFTIKANAHN